MESGKALKIVKSEMKSWPVFLIKILETQVNAIYLGILASIFKSRIREHISPE